MIQFKRLQKTELTFLRDYFENCPITFNDLSVGVRYLWCDEFIIEYAIVDDTVILKESYEGEKDAFYFPMGNNIEKALSVIEQHSIEKSIPIRFCCIDTPTMETLKARYYITESHSELNWNDYIYNAEDFKTYKGKKFSTQRNHLNKFKRNYPNYQFSVMTSGDLPDVMAFLKEYFSLTKKQSSTFLGEEKNIPDYIANFEYLDQQGGIIRVDGKIVGLSVGEVVRDTLIVHVEKALKSYDGVYPVMAQEFAKAFATEKVKYINREEDCGDSGLRYSKTQYNPIEIKDKWVVVAKTVFENIAKPIYIKTDRLTIEDIPESDKADYYRLYMDDELNKLWGYDYRDDCKGTPTPDYFYNFQLSLKQNKEEYSLAVKKDGKMVGELVLHNFDFFGGVEMGFRFFSDCQGKGYATESALALKEYVKTTLKAKFLKSRCFKQNIPSKNLIGRIGLKEWYEDQTRYFFREEL